MTESVKTLIKAVSFGDVSCAKKIAVQILEADVSKKDEPFCRQMLSVLQNEPMMIQLPKEISKFAVMEDVSQTFISNRYFLTEREQRLYTEITNSDKIGRRLQEKRIRYLNATLLYGESGTGKTTFGRYLAYKLNIPFLYLNFAFLVSSLLGQTGKTIQSVFDFAKQQRCVFMLDELDAIGTERGKNNDVGETSRVVISLMQSLDLLRNDAIVLAATNRYDDIDEAVKRRFARSHKIESLYPEERISFCKTYLADCGYDMTEKNVAGIIGKAEKQSDIENRLINYIIRQELEEMK